VLLAKQLPKCFARHICHRLAYPGSQLLAGKLMFYFAMAEYKILDAKHACME
jgi:hypothetical protein